MPRQGLSCRASILRSHLTSPRTSHPLLPRHSIRHPARRTSPNRSCRFIPRRAVPDAALTLLATPAIAFLAALSTPNFSQPNRSCLSSPLPTVPSIPRLPFHSGPVPVPQLRAFPFLRCPYAPVVSRPFHLVPFLSCHSQPNLSTRASANLSVPLLP